MTELELTSESTTQTQPEALAPRWLFWWSVLTVLAVFPLLTLGAEVTTKGVGMVDRVGFRAPWHLLEVWWRGELEDHGGLAFVIEHSHRVAGFVVGICVIVLMLGLWFGARQVWLKRLGVAALLAVVLQGLLGKYRVDLNALAGTDLAMIHGCTAQLVFALLISIAVFTSRAWLRPITVNCETATRLRRLALATVLLVYGQLVLGALVRHNYWLLGARVHLLTAFLVVALIVWLIREISQAAPGRGPCIWAGLLGVLLLLQLGLGLESWLCKFQPASMSEALMQVTPISSPAGFIRSLHYVTGSLVFVTTVILTLLLYRPAPALTQPTVLPETREAALEEVA